MEDSNSDGLPPGWTVEVKVRKNGKIDKYYYPPLGGLKFNSKVEVLRYLEKKAQNKVSIQRNSENVEVEDGIAGGLPPGLMKNTEITMNGDTIRRDSSAEGITMKPESSDQKEMKVGLAGGTTVSSCGDEVSQETQQLQENSETKHGTEKVQAQNRRCKNKLKKEADLPRRASKRLAGIKVDQLPELQTRSRPRRDAATKQSGEEESIINADKYANNSSNAISKQFNAALDGSETLSKSDTNMTENEDKIDAKIDCRLNFPLKELLSDPCIAFAIQTLTGATFETSKDTQISCETSASADEHGKKINLRDGDSAGCNVFGSNEKGNENAGSSSENKTLDTSWMDPCIEFAIKTLTSSTIQLDSDQNAKNCFQQQLSSSNNQHNESDYCGNQYTGIQKSLLNQSFVDPTQKHTRNTGMGNPSGARFSHW